MAEFKTCEFISLKAEIERLPLTKEEFNVINLVSTFKDLWREYQRILFKNKFPLTGSFFIEVLTIQATINEYALTRDWLLRINSHIDAILIRELYRLSDNGKCQIVDVYQKIKYLYYLLDKN